MPMAPTSDQRTPHICRGCLPASQCLRPAQQVAARRGHSDGSRADRARATTLPEGRKAQADGHDRPQATRSDARHRHEHRKLSWRAYRRGSRRARSPAHSHQDPALSSSGGSPTPGDRGIVAEPDQQGRCLSYGNPLPQWSRHSSGLTAR